MTADPEAAYLAEYDPSRYERPSVAVDVVLLTLHEGGLRVVLHRRPALPAAGQLALPGGFLHLDETLLATARRVLAEKAGLTEELWLEQLATFDAPDRDRRTRVLSVAHLALVNWARIRPALASAEHAVVAARLRGVDDAGRALLTDEHGAPLALAFDHAEIVGTAVTRVRGKLDYAPVEFQLLGEEFTLRALQEVHETILGTRLNKDSFRRRMLDSGRLAATGRREEGVGHRPAELFRRRGV